MVRVEMRLRSQRARAILTLALWIAVPVLAQPQNAPAPMQMGDMQMEDAGGLFGQYQSTRESTGTAWQPASSPMEGIHLRWGEWSSMLHGFATGVYSHDPNPRGDRAAFSTNMFMFRTQRSLARGTFGTKVMLSLEPTLGKRGYPLLLQTGETADGIDPLFDRQHPHDAVMELAITYSLPVTDNDSVFVYFAPVGEPAIGPSAFMHRFSGEVNPMAPISHHWLDATHITYGVLTAGYVLGDRAKIEGSLFRGREPDADRWGIEPLGFDSQAVRLTVNPNPNWSLQASFASMNEPEILHPGVDMLRFTTSATYNRPIPGGNWQITLAWGLNRRDPTTITVNPNPVSAAVLPTRRVNPLSAGPTPRDHVVPLPPPPGRGPVTVVIPQVTLNALLAESTLRFDSRHTVFGRFEFAEKDELFPSDDVRGAFIHNVVKLNVGYIYDLPLPGHVGVGVGGAASLHFVPGALEAVYGASAPASYRVFTRFRLK